MPRAPATRSGRSDTGLGQVGEGSPSGSTPTSETPWSERWNAEVAAIAATTATNTPGMRASQRWRIRISARLTIPTAAAADSVTEHEPAEELPRLVDKPVRLGREAEELRQLPDQVVSASPFM